jgi:Cu2+-exporting ATPase/Cu+-exporting ATPase
MSTSPAPASPDHRDKNLDYAYLDQEEFRRRYGHPSDTSRMFFFVENVTCTKCLFNIENIRNEVDGLSEVRLDMGRHIVEVQVEPAGSMAGAAARLKELGHTPHPIAYASLNDESKTSHKSLLVKMGVAGAAAGNIMLLTTSLYSGAQQSEYAGAFEWLTFLLFLPVLLYSATPFYRNSWSALRNRRSSIDIPIAAAVVIGSGLGLYHLAVGRGDIYFDSLAVLVFLLLASRFLLFRLQNKFLGPNHLRSFYETDKVRTIDPETGRVELRHIATVMRDDEVVVYGGERIPVDGFLASDEAYINAAVLTGEVHPQRVLPGQMVFAGTQLASGEATVRVEKTGRDTRVGQLLVETERGVLGRTPLISLTDRAAQWFSASVLTIGLLFAVAYCFVDAREAIDRGLALVILACPCALALATPLTQSLALRKAARRGALIKKAEAFEKLYQVEKVFLDKTGTLTRGELDFKGWWPSPAADTERSVIHALEKGSHHPVARVLSAEVSKLSYEELRLDDHREIPGTGVVGRHGGDYYELRSPKTGADLDRLGPMVQGGNLYAALYRNGDLVRVAVLGDHVRDSGREVVKGFEARGRKVYLLTGDVAGTARAVAQQVGIAAGNVYASSSPEEKKEILQSNPKSLMVGDGVNDSVALANAHVGVAVHGSMEVSFRAADIYLTQPGLRPLAGLFELARATIFIIKRNLLISLIYNAVGATLALLGYISPLIAAVLMPVSSVTVVLLSVMGTRFWRHYARAAGETRGVLDAPVTSPAPGGGGA